MLTPNMQPLPLQLKNLLRLKIPKIQKTRSFVTTQIRLDKSAPSFSSLSDESKIVTKLGLNRIGNVIRYGNPNHTEKFSDYYKVDIDTWSKGALEAVSVVTKNVSNQNWNSLDGLVSENCIKSLKLNFDDFTETEKYYLEVIPENVFFHFISNPENCESGKNLNLVTYSLPNLENARSNYEEINRITLETKQKMDNLKEFGASSQEEANEMMKRIMQEHKEKIDQKRDDQTLWQNEILIGNYRFVLNPTSQDWILTEMSQTNTLTHWPAVYRWRWKLRLDVSLKTNMSFLKILRADYLMDFSAVSCSVLLTLFIVIFFDVDDFI